MRTLRKYCVEADCWKEMPTHNTRSATAMSSSMRSYTVSGVMTESAQVIDKTNYMTETSTA